RFLCLGKSALPSRNSRPAVRGCEQRGGCSAARHLTLTTVAMIFGTIHAGKSLKPPCATPFCVPVNSITPSNDSVGTPARVRRHLPPSDRAYERRRSRGRLLISL